MSSKIILTSDPRSSRLPPPQSRSPSCRAIQYTIYTTPSLHFTSLQPHLIQLPPSHHPDLRPQPTNNHNHPLTAQMCIVLFTLHACSCPPTPAHPHIRLCASAWNSSSSSIPRACPVGSRLSHTVALPGRCAWCRQRERGVYEGARRSERRGRLAGSVRRG